MDDTIRYSDVPGGQFTMVLSALEDVYAKTKATNAKTKVTKKSKSADSAENTSAASTDISEKPSQGTIQDLPIAPDSTDGNVDHSKDPCMDHTDGTPTEAPNGTWNLGNDPGQDHKDISAQPDGIAASEKGDVSSGHTEPAPEADPTMDAAQLVKPPIGLVKPSTDPTIHSTGTMDEDHQGTAGEQSTGTDGISGENITIEEGCTSKTKGISDDASHLTQQKEDPGMEKTATTEDAITLNDLDKDATVNSTPISAAEKQSTPDVQEIKEHSVLESKGHPTEEEEEKNMSEQPRVADTGDGDLQINEPDTTMSTTEAQKTSTDGPSSIDTAPPEQSTEEGTDDGTDDSTNQHGLTHYTAHEYSVTGESAQMSSSDAADNNVTQPSTGRATCSEDTAESKTTALTMDGIGAAPAEGEKGTENKFSAEEVDKESGSLAASDAPHQDSMPVGGKEDDIDRARDVEAHSTGVLAEDEQEEASLKGTPDTEHAAQGEGELPEDQKGSGGDTHDHTADTAGDVGNDADKKDTPLHKGNVEKHQPSEEETPQGATAASAKSPPHQQDTGNGNIYREVWDVILAPENCVLMLLGLLALWLIFWTSSFGNVPYTIGFYVVVIMMHVLLRLWINKGAQ